MVKTKKIEKEVSALKKLLPSEKKEETKKPVEKEKITKSEEKITRPIVEEFRDSGWEDLIDSDASSTLDRRLIRRTGPQMWSGERLEDSLGEAETKEGETKSNETYKSNSATYMGKGGVVGGAAETKREDEFGKFDQVRTMNNWQPQQGIENPTQTNAYELKRNADETLNIHQGVEGFKKYLPRA